MAEYLVCLGKPTVVKTTTGKSVQLPMGEPFQLHKSERKAEEQAERTGGFVIEVLGNGFRDYIQEVD